MTTVCHDKTCKACMQRLRDLCLAKALLQKHGYSLEPHDLMQGGSYQCAGSGFIEFSHYPIDLIDALLAAPLNPVQLKAVYAAARLTFGGGHKPGTPFMIQELAELIGTSITHDHLLEAEDYGVLSLKTLVCINDVNDVDEWAFPVSGKRGT